MADVVQIKLIEMFANQLQEPILEIGSKRYGMFPFFDYRLFFQGKKYVGIDMEPGDGVDVVCDFTKDVDGLGKFKSVICMSVLEHVEDLVSFVSNLEKVLEPGGTLVLSVPFIEQIHGYPSDYWRFTPKAITYLFKSIDFHKNYVHTNPTFEVFEINDVYENPQGFEKLLAEKFGISRICFDMIGVKRGN